MSSMVDAIVSFTVERLGDFLIQEADSLQGVRDGVVWLKRELGMMRCFLKDAEEKQDADHRIREWISEVREAAYHIEDAVDTFTYNVAVGETLKRRRGFLASVWKIARMFGKETDLYNLGKEIEALRKRVDDISCRRQVYGIRNIGEAREGTGGAIGRLRELRRSCPYADEEHVVGFEDDTASLVGKLLNGERRRCVISILGMGGLGKTTLARKLYHHPMVECVFRHRAWVCVSQEYGTRDLLQRIIKSFERNISKEELKMLEKMSEEDLERYLLQSLQEVPYLVVIDDVWEKEAWEILRRAFPDDKNGSRVIVTTRIEAVAERSDERTYVHKLRFLRSDESWELFCRKAFPSNTVTSGGTSRYPSNLEALGREMVKKCEGLPLAIIVLGGLLSRKEPHEWWTVKEHIWRYLRNDSIHISHLLTLSFNDLPCLLKPCFLYFGLFPEDYTIETEKLILLWVAEGFIPPGNDQTMEEVAEDSLNELIGRSLIQVTARSRLTTIYCRVHDLLQDLAVKRAIELNFLHIHSAPHSGTEPSFRRQAAHSNIERYDFLGHSNPRLRTLMLFDSKDGGSGTIESLSRIYTRFRLLRVLDIGDLRTKKKLYIKIVLPDEVGDLIHLKYLGLGGTKIKELPASIVRLQALQTLDAFSVKTMVILRGDIGKLTQLRHLFGVFKGLRRVDHLTNLQTLKCVDIHEWINIDTVNLINLRDLLITHFLVGEKIMRQRIEFTWDPITNLRNLQSLSVKLRRSMYFPSLRPLSNCRCLHQMKLDGKIGNLPEQIHEYLPNLKFLRLENSELMQDPMPILEKLPNLILLQLNRIGNVMKLTCTAEGFARLEVLLLSFLHCLRELEVEEGAMPMLEGFRVVNCNEFIVPERLKPIPNYNDLNWTWTWGEEFSFYSSTRI